MDKIEVGQIIELPKEVHEKVDRYLSEEKAHRESIIELSISASKASKRAWSILHKWNPELNDVSMKYDVVTKKLSIIDDTETE